MLQFICLFDFGTRTCVVNHDVNDEEHCSSQESVKKESKDWHELPVFQAKTHRKDLSHPRKLERVDFRKPMACAVFFKRLAYKLSTYEP